MKALATLAVEGLVWWVLRRVLQVAHGLPRPDVRRPSRNRCRAYGDGPCCHRAGAGVNSGGHLRRGDVSVLHGGSVTLLWGEPGGRAVRAHHASVCSFLSPIRPLDFYSNALFSEF